MSLFKKLGLQASSRDVTSYGGGSFEDETPDVAFAEARRLYFESVGLPTVHAARNWVLAVILGIAVIALVLTLYRLLPLEKIQPVIAMVDKTSGEVRLDANAAKSWQDYQPERAVLEREFFQIVKDMYALNADAQPVIVEGHKRAYGYMRNTAIGQFRTFITREEPYQRMKVTPGLVRSAKLNTITFRSDAQVALVRFTTEERNATQTGVITKSFIGQFAYQRVAITNLEELLANPLGIYVTSFEYQEER